MKIIVFIVVFVVLFFGVAPFIAAWVWNWSVPILFPKVVEAGYINANLDWRGGLALVMFAAVVFGSRSSGGGSRK